ncbi:receptor-type tyrosine-protein phosphatase eta-like, partial [Silurus asotus]
FTVTGLTAGVKYTYTVSAVAADNHSTGAPTKISAFRKPDVLLNLTVSSKTTSSVSLNWNEPNGNRRYFTVQWNNGSGNNIIYSSNTSYNVTGLTAGVKYTLTVTAVAADTQTTGAPTQISAFTNPDVVTNLTVFNKTTSSVYLNWNEPNGNRSYFTVQWNNGSGNNIINTFCTVTGLTAGVNYTFTVTAVAADNQTTGASTKISAFTKPDIVNNLTAVNVTTSSILLYWIKAMGEISYYVVQYDNFSTNISTTTELTSINITNLTPGVQYTFKVFAVVADNKTEGNSSYISAYTKPDVVRDLNVTEITTRSLFLNWTEPIGISSFFKVQWSNNITLKSPTSNTFYNITNLTPGVKYTILISAVAADNITEGGAIGLSVFTKPDTVSNLTAVNVTTSSILLYWIKAMGEISYYVVQYDNFSTNISTTTELTKINITNLTPGVQYTFKVFAVVADNKTEGNSSYISAYTKPDVVRDLNVTKITTSSLFLNWTEPIGKSSFFKVQWGNDITLNSTTSNTFYDITNLSPGVNYTILISAVAADNITEGGAIGLSVFTKPDTVSNLTAVNVTTSSILLYWIKAMGEISYYVVQYDNFSTYISTTTEITMINITNLTPGVQYTFKVFAVVADNKTEGNSSSISAYTKPDTVSNLTAVNVTTSSILLYWIKAMGEISYYVVQYDNFSRNISMTTELTRINITNLTPGVQYTFKVFAVVADNKTEGNSSYISAYTKPDIVRNLKTSEVTTTSVFLSWTEPLGNRSFFRVQWINSSTTTSATSFNITGLTPGTNYTFTVSAVADDNKTEGSVVGLSICTGTSPVFNISCVGPNRTAAALNLTWTNPPGNNQGFNINLNSAFSNFIPFCNPVCTYFISNSLQYFNTYNLTISTLGCGEIGSWDFKCRTGITEPPVPGKPEHVVIKVTSVCKTAVTLQFSSNLLNSANGPIEAYGVLLSTDPQSNNSKTFLRMTYNDWLQEKTKTYLTVLKLNNNIITKSNMILVEIGNGKGSDVISNEDFKNGPLSNQSYRVALVLFTYLKIRDRLVDIQQSIFSVTPFS